MELIEEFIVNTLLCACISEGWNPTFEWINWSTLALNCPVTFNLILALCTNDVILRFLGLIQI